MSSKNQCEGGSRPGVKVTRGGGQRSPEVDQRSLEVGQRLPEVV